MDVDCNTNKNTDVWKERYIYIYRYISIYINRIYISTPRPNVTTLHLLFVYECVQMNTNGMKHRYLNG